MALPRSQRLRKDRDIRNVLRRSWRLETRLLTARIHKKPTLPGRAAVVVPKKVLKSAAARNLMRRRIGEWLRVKFNVGGKPMDLLVTAKQNAAGASRAALLRDLEILLAQAHL